jgi:hypothetical protein
MFCKIAIGQWLVATTLATSLIRIKNSADWQPQDSNVTINIGYFLQADPRIAAIGMAIDQAQSDGLLVGYNFE